MKLREINKKEFFDFCKKEATNNFFQTKEYAELSRKKGWYTYFLGVDQNGKIRAATMLLARNLKFSKSKIFYAPRGFIINFKDLELVRFLTRELKIFIEERKGAFLRINPYYPLKQLDNSGNYVPGGFNNQKSLEVLNQLGYKKSQGIITAPQFLYTLDLKGKNEDELLTNCSQPYQKIILDNIRRGFITKEIDETQLSTVLELISNSRQKINFIEDLSLLNEFYQIFKESNMIKINLVQMDIDLYLENIQKEKENIDAGIMDQNSHSEISKELELVNNLQYQYGHKVILGCNISICYGREVTTISTAVNNKFIEFNPLYTLTWNTIKDAKKNGYEIYNFYGFGNDLSEQNSIYQYYKGFHGELIQLIGEFDLVINEFIYKHYCEYSSKHKKKITDFKK